MYLIRLTLWVSAEMLVIPRSLKSKSGIENPALGMNASKNPPRQASVWTGMLYFTPISAMAAILSMQPWGKAGAEPTS